MGVAMLSCTQFKVICGGESCTVALTCTANSHVDSVPTTDIAKLALSTAINGGPARVTRPCRNAGDTFRVNKSAQVDINIIYNPRDASKIPAFETLLNGVFYSGITRKPPPAKNFGGRR